MDLGLLNSIVMIAIIIAGLTVVLVDDILPSIIAFAVLGTLVALEFLLLQAPDVALAEVAVGAILTPIMFVIALNKCTDKTEKEEK